jgi:sterol 24-C-methyltransferase
MRSKDKAAQKEALSEYFKVSSRAMWKSREHANFPQHFDGKPADTETEETREARKAEYATLTRHYYNLATDLVQWNPPDLV